MGRPLAFDSAVRWMTSFESSRSKYGPVTPFVVASEDRFLSHCGVRFGETEWYPDEVVSALGIVYTIPQERQKGWAKACVRAATDFALKQPGIKRVLLLVADRNIEAQKFYDSLGFTPSSHTLLNNDIPMTLWTAQLPKRSRDMTKSAEFPLNFSLPHQFQQCQKHLWFIHTYWGFTNLSKRDR